MSNIEEFRAMVKIVPTDNLTAMKICDAVEKFMYEHPEESQRVMEKFIDKNPEESQRVLDEELTNVFNVLFREVFGDE